VRIAILLTLVACNAEAETKTADTCVATGKPLGTKLTAWKPPAECTLKGGTQSPRSISNDADARAHLECKDPKAKLGVDFAKQQLIVTSRSLSPAGVGFDVYDDGKKITVVSRQRNPCKNDPRPMPGPNTTMIFQTTGGARVFADAACTVESKCP
jgi:hypothetical protein